MNRPVGADQVTAANYGATIMDPDTRRRLVDTAIAIAMAVVLWVRLAAPFESGNPPDWRGYVIAGLMGAVLLVRRRRPVVVLVASIVLLVGYYQLGFAAIGIVWPLAVALFTVAERGRWVWGPLLVGPLLVGSWAFRVGVEAEAITAATLADFLNELILAALLLLAGAMVRNSRLLAEQATAREAAVRAEAATRRERELDRQRLAIARDVHDLVAHSLAGIGVQARLAAEQVVDDPDQARATIATIDDSTREALAGLRQTVGGLRGQPATDDLATMVARVSGVDAVLSRPAPPARPDPERERLVLSVAREALTNVVRHADATTARVTVEDRVGETVVRVVDDGRGGPVSEGHGLTGMRERLGAVGGTLEVADAPTGGVALTAVIPHTAEPHTPVPADPEPSDRGVAP